jgi:hypothetical protein
VRAMSGENVEVARAFLDPFVGQEVVATLREATKRLGPEPDEEAILAAWAEDPSFRHADPQIRWEIAGPSAVATNAVGAKQLVRWWRDWVEAWETYTYRVAEYRDLGGWVLAVVDVKARGRGGIPVEMRTYQSLQIRGGKISACRIFQSEPEALEAAALSA